MRKYIYANLLIFSFILLNSCKNIKDNKSEEFRGAKEIVFNISKGKDGVLLFNRKYLDTLSEIKSTKFNAKEYTLLQNINDTIISTFDYGQSHILFIDQNLSQLTDFKDSDNKNVLSYNYNDSALYVYDFGSKNLKEYVSYLSVKSKFTFKKNYILPSKNDGVYRIAPLANNKFLAVYPKEEKNDLIFYTIEIISDSLRKIDSLLLSTIMPGSQNIPYVDMAYDGDFAWNNLSKELVYKFRFSSGFIKFNKESGKYLYVKNTVEKMPPPLAKYVQISPNAKRLEITPNILFFPSNSISDHYLYILNFITPDKDAAIDIYNLNDFGNYLKSIYIPTINNGKYPRSITVVKRWLYVLYEDNTLLKYQINAL